MLQDLDPLRHPAAFALSRTAVARGMMMPIWMVLDASSRFRNRFMLNSLKMAEHRGTIKIGWEFWVASSSLRKLTQMTAPWARLAPSMRRPEA